MKKTVISCLLLFSFSVLNCYAQKRKKVIAIQALFLQEHVIDSLRLAAQSYDNITSARTNGARPHMTIASFWLTDRQISELSDSFAALNKKFMSHRFEVRLSVENNNNSREYYLVPATKDPILFNIHDSLYTQVDKGYERQRKIDMPGSWWPHISLFEIQGDSSWVPEKILQELKSIKYVTLKGFSLVSFGPMRYFSEIETLSIDE